MRNPIVKLVAGRVLTDVLKKIHTTLRETRTLNGYGFNSLFNHKIDVPVVPEHDDVEINIIPDLATQALEVGIWFEQKIVHSLAPPLVDSKIHFLCCPNKIV